MLRQLLKFGAVGGIGFVVDGGILTLLHAMTDWGPLWPRVVSFPAALSVTWYLNRIWTFSDTKSGRKAAEYTRYAIVQGSGILVNFVVYAGCLWAWPKVMGPTPIIALAIASGVAMFVNYFGARTWVFLDRS